MLNSAFYMHFKASQIRENVSFYQNITAKAVNNTQIKLGLGQPTTVLSGANQSLTSCQCKSHTKYLLAKKNLLEVIWKTGFISV